jgi:hypothetical protein
MPTETINHHIIITDEEQNMIVNALAFFQEFFSSVENAASGAHHSWKEWQDVANDTNLDAVDTLATTIATSN